uniref:Uncharacterized protein n=1 Tax=Arundo donax TaxID=35708 RepID=A0A0A9GWB5_ARUDO
MRKIPMACLCLRYGSGFLDYQKKLRKYKILWALGSMFGATQKVDMKMTKCNRFGHFFVAILNPSLIPNMMDVVIGDKYFELKFMVEQDTMANVPMQMETKEEERDDKSKKNHDKSQKDRDSKRPKNGENGTGKELMSEDSNAGMSFDIAMKTIGGSVDNDKIQALATKILDMVVNNLVFECTDKVLAEEEEEEGTVEEMVSDGEMEEVQAAECDLPDGVVLQEIAIVNEVTQPEASQPSQVLGMDAAWLAMSIDVAGPDLSSILVPSPGQRASSLGPTQVEGAALGLIGISALTTPTRARGHPRGSKGASRGRSVLVSPAAGATPRRHSKCQADSTDEHSIVRATRLVAKRNLESTEDMSSNSILSFSDKRISDNIQNIGVSMGNNVNESIALIRKIEMDRTVFTPDKRDAGNLCGDLTEEVMDDIMDGQASPHHIMFKRNNIKKSSLDKQTRRVASKKHKIF